MKMNKLITGIIAVAVIIAVVVLVYVNLPSQPSSNGDNTTPPPTTRYPILNITYNDYHVNYTLSELEAFPTSTGEGSYLKVNRLPNVSISGPNEYTGVTISYLLSQIPNLPTNFSITATSTDDYTVNYNTSQIQGNVEIYDESGNITGIGNVTMLVAYKEDGEYIPGTEDGPVRIVFVDDGQITPSPLWAKMVESLIITD